MNARRRKTRVLDWRFLAALTFMMLVAYFVFGGLAAIRENAQLVTAVQRQTQNSKDARETAAAQRQSLLDAQQQLLRQNARLQRKQDELLAYLRDNGITLPGGIDRGGAGSNAPADRTRSRGPAGRPPGGVSKPSTTPKGSGSVPSPAPAPTTPASPAAPAPAPGEGNLACVLTICIP